jgi:hypothetical protein
VGYARNRIAALGHQSTPASGKHRFHKERSLLWEHTAHWVFPALAQTQPHHLLGASQTPSATCQSGSTGVPSGTRLPSGTHLPGNARLPSNARLSSGTRRPSGTRLSSYTRLSSSAGVPSST